MHLFELCYRKIARVGPYSRLPPGLLRRDRPVWLDIDIVIQSFLQVPAQTSVTFSGAVGNKNKQTTPANRKQLMNFSI